MQLGLRVDVDTRIGLSEGVPRLLDVLRRYCVRASFFVSFGPDNSGKALRRAWRPSFLLKMLRTNPFRLYGARTLLSGMFLPSRPIGEGEPELLRAIRAEGHELGIHGYDHVYWQDHVESMAEREIEAELSKAKVAYERVLGVCPVSSAAPGWRCTLATLVVQERLGLLYASDVRGVSPFFPVHDGRRFKTLQIPTTLPTLDELLGRERRMNELLLSSLRRGVNVHTVHAEVEGRPYLHLFEEFLKEILKRGIQVLRLGDVAEIVLNKGHNEIRQMSIERQKIPGRSGWVACQILKA